MLTKVFRVEDSMIVITKKGRRGKIVRMNHE
jgi:hypothetical protein